MVILYFGVIAEITEKKQEVFEHQFSDVQEMVLILKNKYKRLENVLFNVAINQRIVDLSTLVNLNDEIAILPPFAGG